MRKYIIISLLFITCLAQGQNTTAVTATVTAPDGQVFANGTVTAVFTPPSGIINQNQYLINGVTFTYSVSGTMDGSGTFNITLTDDHKIRPQGGRWNFIVCPAATIPCTQSIQDVFGASINLSGLISADVKNFTGQALLLPRFYTDAEANTVPLGGLIYYKLPTSTVRLYTGAGGWVDLTGTGGGSFLATVPTTNQKAQPDAGHPTTIALTMQCPTGAAAGLQCAQVLDSNNNVIGQWTNDGQAMIPKLNGTIYCGLPVTDLGATLSSAIVAANTLGQGEVDCSNIPFAVNMTTGVNANIANIYIRMGVVDVSVTGSGAAHWTIQGNNQVVKGAGVGLTTWDVSQVTGTTIFFQVGSGNNTTNNSLFTDMSFIGNRILVCGVGGANNFCRTGGGDSHHGMTLIKVGTNAPTIQTNVVFERISISNAGFLGIQVDNCTTCALRNSFFDHTWSSAIQVNSSQVTANAVFGGLYIGNVLLDTNVGCGVLGSGTGQNCGDGEFNLISQGGYQALGPTRVEANYIANTAGALCNSVLQACSWDNTKQCGGGEVSATGCGQGIQAVYNAWKVDMIGNSVYHTPNEGIAATGSATITGNHVEDNSCCAGGAGGIVDYVDPAGIGKGFVASGNVVKDGGYCFSLQLGATGIATDSAVVDGINFSGNDCEGTGNGGTSIQNAFRIRNNCTTCVTHNSTLNHIVFSNNTIHGAINNVFQQIDPTTVASGVGIFTDNSPNVKTGQQQIINANNARTNFSITTGNANLMTYPKGVYLVTYIFQTHTAGAAGSPTITFNYTDSNNHAKSVGPFSIDDTSTGNTGITQGSFVASLDPAISASKDITFSIAGALGAGATYDAYVTMEPFSQVF